MLMKALTISQPWADLIRDGEKFTENRFWSCAYRGPLAIHAGKGTQYLTKDQLKRRTTGAVVAIAELVACVVKADLARVDYDMLIEGTPYTVGDVLTHRYAEGPCLWVLDNIQPIEPIFVPGKQGLWLWSVDQSQIKYLEPKS